MLGDLKYILGFEIAKSPKGTLLSQRKYTLQLQVLPTDPDIKHTETYAEPLLDVTLYKRWIGRFMYLTISFPDITYAVISAASICQNHALLTTSSLLLSPMQIGEDV